MQQIGDNMMSVKRTNRSAILRALHERGAVSRKQLAEDLKLTPAAITKIVAELMEEGFVTEGASLACGKAGRREILMELKPQARCALGVLINRRQAILSAVWLDGSVIFSREIELPPEAPADETVRELAVRLLALAEENGLHRDSILGIGAAIRGITDRENRQVLNAMGALDTADYPLAQRLEEFSGLRCVMANNVRALFAAQMFMARDRETRSQFFLRCEYGIGAALSVNDGIWPGGTGRCSEIGHIPVRKRGGKPCVCGKSGCLETIASPMAMREDTLAILSKETTPVLWNRLGGKKPERLEIDEVLNAARNGDEAVARIVDRAVDALSSALKSVIYIIDPEKIVLYGRVFDNSYYLSRLMAEMNEGVDSGHSVVIERSRYNGLLEDKAAGLVMVEDFFANGGMK